MRSTYTKGVIVAVAVSFITTNAVSLDCLSSEDSSRDHDSLWFPEILLGAWEQRHGIMVLSPDCFLIYLDGLGSSYPYVKRGKWEYEVHEEITHGYGVFATITLSFQLGHESGQSRALLVFVEAPGLPDAPLPTYSELFLCFIEEESTGECEDWARKWRPS